MTLSSCARHGDLDTMPTTEKTKLKLFEEDFVAGRIIGTRSIDADAVQLLGFTSVQYSGDEILTTKVIWEKYAKEIADTKFTFTSYDGSFLRIYYPLHTATVTYKGKTYVADKNGIVVIKGVKDISDIRVIGRQTSDKIVPAERSTVKDGSLIFHSELSTKNIYKDQRTLVFDLGYRQKSCCKVEYISPSRLKTRGEDGDDGEENGGTVSCLENHGDQNCTAAFPDVATQRCSVRWGECMDFNGWGTDCSGSGYFAGSDCFWALAQGQCWNEVM